MARHQQSGESVDIFLANLRKLILLFWGILGQENDVCCCGRTVEPYETNTASIFENGRDEFKRTIR